MILRQSGWKDSDLWSVRPWDTSKSFRIWVREAWVMFTWRKTTGCTGKVALKLLPGQVTADTERLRRFEREAQAASALNHPNILTIHEIGETNGTHFIATEFIEGETLRERMTGAPMPIGEVLRCRRTGGFGAGRSS